MNCIYCNQSMEDSGNRTYSENKFRYYCKSCRCYREGEELEEKEKKE